jgi:hypothetical protein
MAATGVGRFGKMTELRTREATELVAAYASGGLSPKEAENRFVQYSERWPEALPGTHTFKGASDAQILAAIDETRRPDFPERQIERYRRENRGGSPDKSR